MALLRSSDDVKYVVQLLRVGDPEGRREAMLLLCNMCEQRGRHAAAAAAALAAAGAAPCLASILAAAAAAADQDRYTDVDDGGQPISPAVAARSPADRHGSPAAAAHEVVSLAVSSLRHVTSGECVVRLAPRTLQPLVCALFRIATVEWEVLSVRLDAYAVLETLLRRKNCFADTVDALVSVAHARILVGRILAPGAAAAARAAASSLLDRVACVADARSRAASVHDVEAVGGIAALCGALDSAAPADCATVGAACDALRALRGWQGTASRAARLLGPKDVASVLQRVQSASHAAARAPALRLAFVFAATATEPVCRAMHEHGVCLALARLVASAADWPGAGAAADPGATLPDCDSSVPGDGLGAVPLFDASARSCDRLSMEAVADGVMTAMHDDVRAIAVLALAALWRGLCPDGSDAAAAGVTIFEILNGAAPRASGRPLRSAASMLAVAAAAALVVVEHHLRDLGAAVRAAAATAAAAGAVAARPLGDRRDRADGVGPGVAGAAAAVLESDPGLLFGALSFASGLVGRLLAALVESESRPKSSLGSARDAAFALARCPNAAGALRALLAAPALGPRCGSDDAEARRVSLVVTYALFVATPPLSVHGTALLEALGGRQRLVLALLRDAPLTLSGESEGMLLQRDVVHAWNLLDLLCSTTDVGSHARVHHEVFRVLLSSGGAVAAAAVHANVGLIPLLRFVRMAFEEVAAVSDGSSNYSARGCDWAVHFAAKDDAAAASLALLSALNRTASGASEAGNEAWCAHVDAFAATFVALHALHSVTVTRCGAENHTHTPCEHTVTGGGLLPSGGVLELAVARAAGAAAASRNIDVPARCASFVCLGRCGAACQATARALCSSASVLTGALATVLGGHGESDGVPDPVRPGRSPLRHVVVFRGSVDPRPVDAAAIEVHDPAAVLLYSVVATIEALSAARGAAETLIAAGLGGVAMSVLAHASLQQSFDISERSGSGRRGDGGVVTIVQCHSALRVLSALALGPGETTETETGSLVLTSAVVVCIAQLASLACSERETSCAAELDVDMIMSVDEVRSSLSTLALSTAVNMAQSSGANALRLLSCPELISAAGAAVCCDGVTSDVLQLQHRSRCIAACRLLAALASAALAAAADGSTLDPHFLRTLESLFEGPVRRSLLDVLSSCAAGPQSASGDMCAVIALVAGCAALSSRTARMIASSSETMALLTTIADPWRSSGLGWLRNSCSPGKTGPLSESGAATPSRGVRDHLDVGGPFLRLRVEDLEAAAVSPERRPESGDEHPDWTLPAGAGAVGCRLSGTASAESDSRCGGAAVVGELFGASACQHALSAIAAVAAFAIASRTLNVPRVTSAACNALTGRVGCAVRAALPAHHGSCHVENLACDAAARVLVAVLSEDSTSTTERAARDAAAAAVAALRPPSDGRTVSHCVIVAASRVLAAVAGRGAGARLVLPCLSVLSRVLSQYASHFAGSFRCVIVAALGALSNPSSMDVALRVLDVSSAADPCIAGIAVSEGAAAALSRAVCDGVQPLSTRSARCAARALLAIAASDPSGAEPTRRAAVALSEYDDAEVHDYACTLVRFLDDRQHTNTPTMTTCDTPIRERRVAAAAPRGRAVAGWTARTWRDNIAKGPGPGARPLPMGSTTPSTAAAPGPGARRDPKLESVRPW